MRLFPKHMSDAEYVAAVRKSVQSPKWLRIFNTCMGIVLMIFFCFFWQFIFSVEDTFPEYAKAIRQGAYVGIMLGAFAGFILVGAGRYLFLAIAPPKGGRTARLMLRFYDALTDKGISVQPEDEGDDK